MIDGADDGLLRTCVHECAHLAVARHYGACGFAHVVAVLHPDGARGYAGRFQMHGELDDDAWRVVALAGAVAECLAEDAHASAEVIATRLAEGTPLLSGVDRQLAEGYAPRHVEACVARVRASWREIVSDARSLARERGAGA